MNFLKSTLVSFAVTTTLFAGNYAIDTSLSNANFTVKHLKVTNVTGTFNDMSGNFEYDEETNKLKSLKGEIVVSSINTADEKRDEHLKSEDILNVKKFPKIFFKSTKIEDNIVYGDLTIRNVTKNIKLELENQAFLDKQVIFSMKGETKRSYFDISWDELLETGSIAVSDEIKLTINIKGNLIEEPKHEEKKEDKKKTNKKVTEKKKETK